MGLFGKTSNGVSTISADELESRLSEAKKSNRWLEKLAEKGREKPFSEENVGVYWLSVALIFFTCVFFVAAAWLPVYTHLNSYFSFLGFLSGTAATVLGLFLLGAIEFFRYQNATAFFERFFIREKFHPHLLLKGLFFTAATAVLAWLAAPDTIALLIPAPTRPVVALETYDALQSSLQPQISDASRAADDFFKARSWQGKLDPADGRRYTQLKSQAAKLRADLADGIRRIDERNSAKNADAATAFQQSLSNADAAKLKAERTVILAIIFCEAIFWLCFWFKERYEYLCLMEAGFSGQLPTKPSGPAQKSGGQNGFHVIQGGSGGTNGQKAAILNEITAPSVIQPVQPRVMSIGESLNEIITYWGRAVSYDLKGDRASFKSAFAEVKGRAEAMLQSHGFQFVTVGPMLYVSNPLPSAKREERERDGRTVATLLPEASFRQEVESAKAAAAPPRNSAPIDLDANANAVAA